MYRKKGKVTKMTAGQRKLAAKRKIIRRPGVITYIMELLEKARDHSHGLTVEQILTKLQQKFPDRDVQGMEVTVRAQLSRLPKEREFGIYKEHTSGREVRYMAA